MLLQLLVYYGVLQPIRNLLRFLKIDSEVFRSRTLGEPFDGAQRSHGLFTIFSDALHYDVPAHVSSWLVSRGSEPQRRNFGQDPQVLSSLDLTAIDI
jgi:hypothetical protein